jgi:hypothetical protein
MALAVGNLRAIILRLRFVDGVLAQLVERLNGIEEVRGSSPLGSKSLKDRDLHDKKSKVSYFSHT